MKSATLSSHWCLQALEGDYSDGVQLDELVGYAKAKKATGEFDEWIASMHHGMSQLTVVEELLVRRTFDTLDTNHDGYIDMRECPPDLKGVLEEIEGLGKYG